MTHLACELQAANSQSVDPFLTSATRTGLTTKAGTKCGQPSSPESDTGFAALILTMLVIPLCKKGSRLKNRSTRKNKTDLFPPDY